MVDLHSSELPSLDGTIEGHLEMVERVKGNRFGGLPFNLCGPAVIESPVGRR